MPLHCAAFNGQEAVARVLVDAGADKNAKSVVSQGRGEMLGGQTIFIFLGGVSRRLPVSVLARAWWTVQYDKD
jgi:ankyrin repeat protein